MANVGCAKKIITSSSAKPEKPSAKSGKPLFMLHLSELSRKTPVYCQKKKSKAIPPILVASTKSFTPFFR
jgi:hypothetical protein